MSSDKQHMWVLMTYFPLEVIYKEGEPVTALVSDLSSEMAMEHGLKGCWFCHTPLNDSTVSTDCLGE